MKKYFLVVLFVFVFMLPGFVMADLNDGLIAYYPFDGNARDMSGNGNDGTEYYDNYLPIKYVDGIVGKGVKFDGNYSQYIKIDGNSFDNMTGDLTISVWIISNGDTSDNRAIVSNEEKEGDPTINWPLRLMLCKGTGEAKFDFTLNNGASSSNISSGTNLHDGKPHHIVVTREDYTVVLYIDNVRTAMTYFYGSVDSSNAPLYIGLSPYSHYLTYGSYPFKGIIDELRIYNRALSESEINALYKQGDKGSTNSCSTDNINLCTDKDLCNNAGGYWYDNQCHANPLMMLDTPLVVTTSNAHPSEALEAVEFKSETTLLNPSNHEIKVAATSSVYLQPSLKVDSSDVGKTAILVLYIYIPGIDYGFMAPSNTVTLESEEKFLNLPKTLDFSNAVGISGDVYYGYIIGTTFKYNTYRVTVVEP